MLKLPPSVTLCEVGLRDGLQNEKTQFSTQRKLWLAQKLVEAGFSVVELGSFMSPKAVPQLADTDELYRQIGESPAELRALVANLKGVERAIACGCKKVKLNVSASRAHNLANLNKTPQESMEGFAACAQAAKAAGIALSGSISMPFASPWEAEIPLEDVVAIVETYLSLGVEEISLSDTSGMAVPSQVYEMCTQMQRRYPQVIWWMHFHNTRGLGIANLVAAMEAGITRFDTSFAGLGGCPFVPGAAGNIATEDVVYLLDRMGVSTGIHLEAVMEIGKQVTEWVGHPTHSYLLRAGTGLCGA